MSVRQKAKYRRLDSSVWLLVETHQARTGRRPQYLGLYKTLKLEHLLESRPAFRAWSERVLSRPSWAYALGGKVRAMACHGRGTALALLAQGKAMRTG